MSIRLAINGFGRIGRIAFRLAQEDPSIRVVAINDLIAPDYAAYLLTYDTTHGKFQGSITSEEGKLCVDEASIYWCQEKDPAQLPWRALEIDVVIESTGLFLTESLARAHIEAGARKVVMSAPAKDETPTFVMGVNHNDYQGETVVSNASCTTNCLAPLVKLLHDRFGFSKGLMSTVHASTATQKVVDGPSGKDWRGGRSALQNIIPAATGAAKAVTRVIPELKGKLTGMAFRVPVVDVSVVDLTCLLEKPVSYQMIQETVREASEQEFYGIIRYCEEALVSSDLIGERCSCVFDATAGLALDDHFFKLIAWYDNEVSYAYNLLRLVNLVASRL